MKQKKKLPRYWLGTRKPTELGYQPNRGIGDATFNTQRGISVQPEANAMRQNQLPNALGKLSSAAQYPMQALQNMVPVLSTAGQQAVTQGAVMQGLGLTTNNPVKVAAGQLVQQTGQNSTRSALNAAGKVAAGLGTAWGLYNVGSDIAHAGDTISQGQIANSATTNTITTAGGNTYTERGGLDAQGIMDYEHEMAKSKKIGLTTDAMGLGASVGSFFGPIGTGIGAAAGLVLGGLGSLFGFGDNEEEVEQMMRDQEDVFAMQNRQSRATALDKDTKAEFYNRAADGKRPVWTPAGLIGKKATARVSNGEVVGNFEEGIATRIPGQKNNKDTKLAALKDGDFVISNKYGLSDYAAATGDYAGALNLQEMLMGMRNSKGYKCGKLPGFKFGWDSALSMLPHVMSFMTNQSQYNRAKNADTYAPDTYVDNAEGAKAVNELAQLRYDATPYYREAQRGLNQANWDARRQVGLGMGGRAIAQNANFNAYLNSLAKINATENEANAGYRTAYANALAQLGARNQEARINSNIHKYGWQQQANAAKENWMAQYLKNRDTSFLNGVAEWLKQGQYKDSLAAQNRMLNLYESQTNLDWEKYKNLIQPDNTSTQTTSSTLFYPTPEMQMRRAMGYKNGKLPRREDGLVDTRSDTTYQGYNPNPIPWGAGLGPAGQGPMVLLEGLEAASQVSDNPYLQTGVAPSPMSKAKRIYDRARALNRLNNRKMLSGDLMGTPERWEKYYDKALPFIGGANIGAAGYAGYRLLKDDAERVKRERSKKQKK